MKMQLKSIIGLLRSAAPTWLGGQINFVLGNRGSIVESDFYTKLKKLDVEKENKDKIYHITQVCEVHHQTILSFLQQVHGLARSNTEGSREYIGHNVHV